MGDFDLDTRVKGGEGRYAADLSSDWDAWGPNGGYLAAVMVRAAGAHTAMTRVASMSCQFLSVAEFGLVELQVHTLRASRRAHAVRVSMTQSDRAIAEALVWLVAEHIEGLHHDHAVMPTVADPVDLLSVRELAPEIEEPPIPFWNNVEWKPTAWHSDWDTRPPGEPRWHGWYRFSPRATFADPLVDSCRALPLLDVMGWASALEAHPADVAFVAPNLDLTVQFHRVAAADEWLFADGFAAIAEDGLIGFAATLWSGSGRLLASGSGQLLCRPGR